MTNFLAVQPILSGANMLYSNKTAGTGKQLDKLHDGSQNNLFNLSYSINGKRQDSRTQHNAPSSKVRADRYRLYLGKGYRTYITKNKVFLVIHRLTSNLGDHSPSAQARDKLGVRFSTRTSPLKLNNSSTNKNKGVFCENKKKFFIHKNYLGADRSCEA